jgi:hypothetical protein
MNKNSASLALTVALTARTMVMLWLVTRHLEGAVCSSLALTAWAAMPRWQTARPKRLLAVVVLRWTSTLLEMVML